MIILLDTNVWISYLLARSPHNTIRYVVRTCRERRYQLLVPPELITEVQVSIAKYPYLRSRIPQVEVDSLIQDFQELALIPPPLRDSFPRFSRDAQDDYLIGHAIVAKADFLVTGDSDLLVLGTIEQLRIVSPIRMKNLLEEQQSWDQR